MRLQGVAIFLALASSVYAEPTFSRDVSRIMQAKCQMCHRPNDIAPFSLLSYEDAATWAEDIKRVISEKIMPPWKPVEGFGEFKDAYSLSDDERRTIVEWVDAGAPLGDASELPEQAVPTGEWQLGEPDQVLQMGEAFTPPRGKDVYRCFVVSDPFEQVTYVRAVDVIPANRQVVHHVIMFIDESGESVKLDAAEEGPGYTCFGGPGFGIGENSLLGGWAPGSLPKALPDGIGIYIPKGARLVMQVHYFPAGRTGEDATRVGLYFNRTKVSKRIYYAPIVNTTFAIPPGASNHEVPASLFFPALFGSAKIIQIFPHMHLLGRQIKVEVEDSAKQVTPLIYINDWDFNWQGFYNYKEPVALPGNSWLKATCLFDNSADNPRNPNDPLKTIRWGEGTQDEMCLAFVGLTLDNQNLP
ncbi:MAG TPA: hypothetical protein VM120_09035 [Bryobacteraceae bacterium]|nr:hypothetical protein [Bryobacteraceae bacterium]